MPYTKELSISLSKATKRTSIKHNNRNFKETDWETMYHKHIDHERSVLNKILVQEDIHQKYEELFGDAVKEYNNKQTKPSREINDFYQKVKDSKKLALQREFIVQVGDKYDFEDRDSDNWKIATAILEQYAKSFEKRNPNLVVYNAVIHLDEASPHLHLNVIPVAEGYQRGVQKQPSFDKALKQQGLSANEQDSRDLWKNFRNQEIKVLTLFLKQFEISRKEVGTNKINDVHEYKQVMRDLDQQKKELATLKEKQTKLTKSLEKQPFIDLDNLKAPLTRRSDRIISLNDLFQLRSIQDRLEALSDENIGLLEQSEQTLSENKRLAEENTRLSEELLKIKSDKQQIGTSFIKLKESTKTLKSDFQQLQQKEHDYTNSEELRSELLKKSTHVFELNTENKAVKNKNQQLEEENSTLKTTLQHLTAKYDELKTKFSGLTTYLHEIGGETKDTILQAIKQGITYMQNAPKIKKALEDYSVDKSYYIADNGVLYSPEKDTSASPTIFLDTEFKPTQEPAFNKEKQRYEFIGEYTERGETRRNTLYLSEDQLLNQQPFSFVQSTDNAFWTQVNHQSYDYSQDQGWSR